jgi:hypothetical protein
LTAEQVRSVEVVKWLRYMNMLGHEIYIRPASPSEDHRPPVFLLDDLTPDAIKALKADGLEPCLVGSTSSPQRLQAWVRVGREDLTREEAREAARELARRYGGDPGAAKAEQYGRLYGFTNRKPDRIKQNGGQPPWTRVIEAADRIATAGAALLERVRYALSMAARQQEAERLAQEATRRAMVEQLARRRERERREQVAEDAYGSTYRHWLNVARGNTDLSSVDFGAACGALRDGFSKDEVRQALREISPNLDRRHPKPEDYLDRTVNAAELAVEADRPTPVKPW